MSAILRVRAVAAAACLLLACAVASASPDTSARPRIVGVTVDDLSHLPAVLDSLRALPRRPWVRVVFDVNSSRPADPSPYVRPVGQVAALGPVLGELVDSGALRSMTVLQIAARAAAYVRALRSSVAVWEIGNEVNGDWTGTPGDVARKVQVAYDTVHRLRGRTALTLYENEGCGDGPSELSPVAWAERYVPVRVRSGLDDVLLSYYEPQCEGRRPSPGEWTRRFAALRRLFPRARVGFGEVGLPKAATPSTRATAASIIAYYYGLRIALPYFVGGGFYWHFAEDMVPRSGSPLWAALARAWLGTGARLRRAPRASADIAPPPHAGFSYQIGGPFAPAPGVGVVDRDRHAAPAPGTYDICYVNGFQAQPDELRWWRARHPSLLLRRGGRAVLDTSWNEQLLDISTAAKRRAVAAIVGDWIRSCTRAGYRAVELDNLDSFARSRGALTAADNLALARLLIARAHSAGLAIAQKNGAELVRTGRRLGFDFAIAEECQAYGECGRYLGAYGDRVIEVEYPDNGGKRNFDRACRSRGDRISIVYRDRGVTPAGRAGFIERRCRVTASGHVSRAGPVPAQDLTLGAATPTPVPAPRVAGARLVDAHRRPLTLRGVNFSGAQYECLDDTRVWDVPADARALAGLRRWRVNAVRLPLNEDCWLGINGKPLGRSAASYRQTIVRWVDRLHANGIVVLLNLHVAAPGRQVSRAEAPMADADHGPAFWSSVARTFRGDPSVLFDLYNEPKRISWSCWRDGCRRPYAIAGMSRLIGSIRATGATQPVVADGLGYSTDLRRWLRYEPRDSLHQLVAGFHVYDESDCATRACWSDVIARVARRVPVLTGEVGEYDCRHDFLDRYLPWADAHHIGYLGWAWNTYDCGREPSLLADLNGTPSPYGLGLYSHLRSRRDP